MATLTVVGGFVKLLILFFQVKIEKDRVRKMKLASAYNKIKQGIKNKDASEITLGFDIANNS